MNEDRESSPPSKETKTPRVSKTLAKVGCQARSGESIILEAPSTFVPLTPQTLLGAQNAHTCSVVLTNYRLIFRDHDEKDTKYSFEISNDELNHATISLSGNALTIDTKAGQTYSIHLDKDNRERLFTALGRELPANAGAGGDLLKLILLLCVPVAWIVGGVLLADSIPEYGMEIIALMVGIPMVLSGFFLGRGGTIFVMVILAIMAIWNGIDGTYPLWVSAVVLLVMGGLSLLGEYAGASLRKASQAGDGSEQ